VLVDARNRRVGTGEKLAVHREGLRHRAFSIFLVDSAGCVLLQRRHHDKYHSGGLWANSCCGHPRPGERTRSAARRRLYEELGIDAPLTRRFRTTYAVTFENGLAENEIVEVYFGPIQGEPRTNPREVAETRTEPLDELARVVGACPGAYTFWLRHYLDAHYAEIAQAITAIAWTPPADAASPASTSGPGLGAATLRANHLT
jgi:isopentenyl-diphosphate delta-isomerase